MAMKRNKKNKKKVSDETIRKKLLKEQKGMKTFVPVSSLEVLPEGSVIKVVAGIEMVEVPNAAPNQEAIRARRHRDKNNLRRRLKQRQKLRIAPGHFNG